MTEESLVSQLIDIHYALLNIMYELVYEFKNINNVITVYGNHDKTYFVYNLIV